MATASAREGGGLALEFAEDGFFVVEEIPDQAVGVAIFEGEGVLGAGAEDARCERVCKVRDVVFVGGGEVD